MQTLTYCKKTANVRWAGVRGGMGWPGKGEGRSIVYLSIGLPGEGEGRSMVYISNNNTGEIKYLGVTISKDLH